jgi:hypothetical protein
MAIEDLKKHKILAFKFFWYNISAIYSHLRKAANYSYQEALFLELLHFFGWMVGKLSQSWVIMGGLGNLAWTTTIKTNNKTPGLVVM